MNQKDVGENSTINDSCYNRNSPNLGASQTPSQSYETKSSSYIFNRSRISSFEKFSQMFDTTGWAAGGINNDWSSKMPSFISHSDLEPPQNQVLSPAPSNDQLISSVHQESRETHADHADKNARNHDLDTFLHTQTRLNTQEHPEKSLDRLETVVAKGRETEDLLQKFKLQQEPITHRGQKKFVHELIQPREPEIQPIARAGLLQKAYSESALHPSSSILRKSRYSNKNITPPCMEDSIGPLIKQSSSNVQFSAPSVHLIPGECDKTMWYSKEDEQRMLIAAFRAMKKKAKRRARRMNREGCSSCLATPSSDTLITDVNGINTTGNTPRANSLTEEKISYSQDISSFDSGISIPPNESNDHVVKKGDQKIGMKRAKRYEKVFCTIDDINQNVGLNVAGPEKRELDQFSSTLDKGAKGELLLDWVHT